ncbi:hypothetical protein TRVA0_073S00122 [Trichomonascus vanleenenianus]|uniref:uncharacterized protein n=1 Tax=Trichomonascus vanleenenianus TaxID=2268995 RepID=UPI003ECA0968
MTIYFERIDPPNVPYELLLNVAECSARGFQEDDLFSFAAGSVFRFSEKDYKVIRHSIRDPRERLKELQARAERYSLWINGWARWLYSKMAESGTNTFVLCEKTEAERNPRKDRVVGYSLWHYPDYMTAELDASLGRTGVWWWIKKNIKLAWYALQDFWYFTLGYYHHPVDNKRFHQFQNAMHDKFKPNVTEAELQGLDEEALKYAAYPEESMVYLSYFAIDPDYQGKGLGKRLMKESLDHIPVELPPFGGPQKMFLEASPAGKPLYEKFGFEEKNFIKLNFNNHSIDATLMLLNRYSYN